MEFWHLLLLFGVLVSGLAWSLAYLLRHWARANSDKVEASKARARQVLSRLASRFRPHPRKAISATVTRHEAKAPAAPGPVGLQGLPLREKAQAPASGASPFKRTARPSLAELGSLPAAEPESVDSGNDGNERSEAREGLPGLDAVRSGMARAEDKALGCLTALFDRLEKGDLPIEDFLKAATLEREEAERQIRCLEVVHGDLASLEADPEYRHARDNCAAAIKCQEWALEFRENLRHSHV